MQENTYEQQFAPTPLLGSIRRASVTAVQHSLWEPSSWGAVESRTNVPRRSEKRPEKHHTKYRTDADGGNRKADETQPETPTILIVEDNLDLQLYFEIELAGDYQILFADNGLDGLDIALQRVPQLIISDVVMPEMDGRELCRRVKQHDTTRHIPVILLTAKADDTDRVAGLSCGADVYFSKSFSISVLKAQIGSTLANRISQHKAKRQPEPVVASGGQQGELERRFTKSVVKVIEQHMGDTEFNPEILADHLNISPRQLYRKLQAISGSTVSEFILRVRMQRATEFLRDWQLNISEIAGRVGFTEASNFSRAFRKQYGCSPSRYRAKL